MAIVNSEKSFRAFSNKFVYLLCFIFLVIQTTSTKECISSHDGVDIQKLLPTKAGWDRFTLKTKPDVTYQYNPCVKMDMSPKASSKACLSVLMCQKAGGDYYPLTGDSMKFYGSLEKKNYVIEYNRTYGMIPEQRMTFVKIVCNKSVSETVFVGPGEFPKLHYTFSLQTSHAMVCNPGQTSTLSAGSILVIIFFVVLTVYLVAGVLIQHYVIGAVGVEMIPNLKFWKECPGLIRDGTCFVIHCGKTDSSYDSI